MFTSAKQQNLFGSIGLQRSRMNSVAVEMDHQPPNFVCSQVHKTRSVLETTQVKLAIR